MAAVFSDPDYVDAGVSGKLQAWDVTVTSHTDGSGTSGYILGPFNGFLWATDTNPDGTDVPTDNWDLYVEDENAVDLMAAACENRDTSTSERAYPGNTPGSPAPIVGTVRLRVANMGDTKKAVVRVYVLAR